MPPIRNGGMSMSKIVGFIIVLSIVVYNSNRRIDGARVKEWWNKGDKI